MNTAQVCWCGPAAPQRPLLEALVQRVFREAYDAQVSAFCPDLLGFLRQGELRGVVGLRVGARAPFFSEQYLDAPAERVISERLGVPVNRDSIVEIGNLAIPTAGDAGWIYAALAAALARAGFGWVLCTTVRSLYHRFRRLGFAPIVLGNADPARLGARAAQWGRYYDQGALLCCGSVSAGHQRLLETRAGRHADHEPLHIEFGDLVPFAPAGPFPAPVHG
ncbi:MAG: thermostable hemolysin [Gammaproteobacteria bacterium]|nr:thermostable hemolysin [Gammaproteobacteria bacterium]